MYQKFGFFIIVCLLATPWVSGAQGITGALAPQNRLVLDPPHPQPGETVTVSIDDYAGGAFGSEIIWRYDGEIIPESTNQRDVEIVAGTLGEPAFIEAELTLPLGGELTLRESFTPIYLDVIVEPQTRTPDWYRGRGMPSIGSQINVTAVVNDGNVIDPAGLVYTWQVNRNVLDAGPVRGRNQMSFATPRGRDMILSLSVSRSNGQIIASKALRIESTMPFLRFYEQHALYGSKPYPTETNDLIIGNTVTIQGEPFFLDTRVYNDPDVAEWSVNGRETDNGSSNPYEITLQRSFSAGTTNLNLHVRSLQEVLQGSEDDISINF